MEGGTFWTHNQFIALIKFPSLDVPPYSRWLLQYWKVPPARAQLLYGSSCLNLTEATMPVNFKSTVPDFILLHTTGWTPQARILSPCATPQRTHGGWSNLDKQPIYRNEQIFILQYSIWVLKYKVMPPTRIELVAFSLWDWRSTYWAKGALVLYV